MAKRQTDSSEQLEVVNLKEFQRELRAIDPKFGSELREANKKAAEIVSDDAKSTYSGLPGLGPRAADSVKILVQQREAAIAIGKIKTRKGVAIILGVEFGGSSDPKHRTAGGGHTTQFQPHRGKQGYALYPAIRKNREEIVNVYGDLLEEVAAAAFPD